MIGEPSNNSSRPRLAIWTPLPPLKTGVADYLAELLPFLDRVADIELFSDEDYTVRADIRRKYKVFPFTDYDERSQKKAFDLNIYQMGNNPFHIYIYEQALTVPGLVVLHDLSISYILYHYYIGVHGDPETFRKEFAYSEGAEALEEFNRIHKTKDQAALLDFFADKYMLKRLVERNYAFLSHMPYCANIIRERYGAEHVYSMYLGSPDPYAELPGADQASTRKDLHLPADQFIIGVFGHLQATKQNDVMLRALAKLKARYPNVLVVFVGEMNRALSYDQFLLGLIKKFKLEANIRMTGFAAHAEMQKYYLACDSIVNLRYPSFGQMSATLSRGVASGRPVIITDLPEWDFFPEDFCWRVPGLDTEGVKLAEYLGQLIEDKELLAQRGNAAREFYLHNGTSAKAAENLLAAVTDVLTNVPKNLEVVNELVRTYNLGQRMYDALGRWDAARAGGKNLYFFTRLRRIPLFGPAIFAAYKLFGNLTRLGEIRAAEWNLNTTLTNSISRLEYKFENLAKTNRIRWQTINHNLADEYIPTAVRVLDNPLGNTTRPGARGTASLEAEYFRAYEAAFGGASDIARQNVMEQIKAYAATAAPVVDLGCGRGEFLAQLKALGVHPIGVSTDRAVVADIQKQGFEVYAQDVFEYLKSAPDNSLGGVTALHMLEYLEHKQILEILALAYQKLTPGGFIYLETPNPLCPDSLGRFYTDPTRQRPIQPFQLSFMLEFSRFSRLKALFLGPIPGRGALSDERWLTLYQNYGILATKEVI